MRPNALASVVQRSQPGAIDGHEGELSVLDVDKAASQTRARAVPLARQRKVQDLSIPVQLIDCKRKDDRQSI